MDFYENGLVQIHTDESHAILKKLLGLLESMASLKVIVCRFFSKMVLYGECYSTAITFFNCLLLLYLGFILNKCCSAKLFQQEFNNEKLCQVFPLQQASDWLFECRRVLQ